MVLSSGSIVLQIGLAVEARCGPLIEHVTCAMVEKATIDGPDAKWLSVSVEGGTEPPKVTYECREQVSNDAGEGGDCAAEAGKIQIEALSYSCTSSEECASFDNESDGLPLPGVCSWRLDKRG